MTRSFEQSISHAQEEVKPSKETETFTLTFHQIRQISIDIFNSGVNSSFDDRTVTIEALPHEAFCIRQYFEYQEELKKFYSAPVKKTEEVNDYALSAH